MVENCRVVPFIRDIVPMSLIRYITRPLSVSLC